MRRIVITAAILACSAGLRAQTLDYRAVEQIFGEPVTTSVTGSPQRASDAPADIDIITADDIRRAGAHDIPEILRRLADIDVLQWTNDYADVSVRGYDQAGSSRLLVLIDGRQVYADYYGFTPWSTLPVELSAIQQIEVVKGPNSALFGFNAVGGVINIITSNPLYDNVNAISITAGTQGLGEGSAVGSFKLGDRAGFRVELGGRSGDDFTTPAQDILKNVRRGDNRGSIDVSGFFQVADAIQLGIEATHSEADETEIAPVLSPFYVRYRTDSVKGQLTADTSIGLLHATAYANWIGADYLYDKDLAPGPASPAFDSRTLVAQFEDVVKLGSNHTVRGSVELRENNASTSPVAGGLVSYDVISVDGMWEWRVAPDFTMTHALRVDYLMLRRSGYTPPSYPLTNSDWNRTLTEESFNSGLVWKADDVDTLRLTVARGVGLPNLVDFGAFVANNFAGNFTGVPTLQPAIVTNYELGWTHTLSGLDARLHASIYHQTTDEIASIIGNVLSRQGTLYVTSGNIGNSSANGITLGIDGNFLQTWHYGIDYSAEIIKDRFEPAPLPGFFQTDFQHSTPNHVLTARLGWASGSWEVDGFLRYESAFDGLMPTSITQIPTLTHIPGYISIDGRVGYRLTDRVTLSLSGQNIPRRAQRQTAGSDVERRVLGSVSVEF